MSLGVLGLPCVGSKLRGCSPVAGRVGRLGEDFIFPMQRKKVGSYRCRKPPILLI